MSGKGCRGCAGVALIVKEGVEQRLVSCLQKPARVSPAHAAPVAYLLQLEHCTMTIQSTSGYAIHSIDVQPC